MHLAGCRSSLMTLAEVFVPGREGLGLRWNPEKVPEDVQGLELVGDFAAGRELELSFLETVEGESDLPVSLFEAEKSLRFQQERSVVPDVVDDREPLFSLSFAEAAAELLHPEKTGF